MKRDAKIEEDIENQKMLRKSTEKTNKTIEVK